MKKILFILFFVLPIESIHAFQGSSAVLNEFTHSLDQDGITKYYFSPIKFKGSDLNLERGSEFIFEILPGDKVEFTTVRGHSFVEGYSTLTGRSENGESIILSLGENTYHGIIHRKHGQGDLEIGTDSNGYFVRDLVHKDDFDEYCPIHDTVSEAAIRAKFGSKEGSTVKTETLEKSVDDGFTIDILALYTVLAEDYAIEENYDSFDGILSQAMALSQYALDYSETGITLRVVKSMQTEYDEGNDGVDSGTRLRRLTFGASFTEGDDRVYFEEERAARDEYGADLVSLFARVSDVGGIAWRLSSPGGNPDFGYNLNNVASVTRRYVLIHEIGHNLGSSHSRTQDQNATETGLFQYSVGYQNETDNYHTVMAYSDGLQQAPVFSNPEQTFNGVIIGEGGLLKPSNNTRSVKLTKRVVSSYRPSVVEPPVLSSNIAAVNEIEVNLLDGQQQDFAFNITNTTDNNTDLVWEIDFEFDENRIATNKRKSGSPSGFDPLEIEELYHTSVYQNPENINYRSKSSQKAVFSTGFETSEGFSVGTFPHINLWTAPGGKMTVSTENPLSGNTHLRLTHDNDGTNNVVSSPYVGVQSMGRYEVSFDMQYSISDTSTDVFDIYLTNASDKSGFLSAGIQVVNGALYTYDQSEDGDGLFFSTQSVLQAGQYYNMSIIYNVDEEQIEYYLDNELVGEGAYLGGYSPDRVLFIHRSQSNNMTLDFDNLSIEKVYGLKKWISLNKNYGIVEAGESGDPLQLSFNPGDLSHGVYSVNMIMRSNDPLKSEIEIPIVLKYGANYTSNEYENELPDQVRLLQNYPNPFNPTTSLSYELFSAMDVRLDVFNILGQRVLEVVNERQLAGRYTYKVDAQEWSSGIYFVRLSTSQGGVMSKKMVLLK